MLIFLAEFYKNKLRLVVDYGNDSLIINDKFEGLDNKDGYILARGENNPKTNNPKSSLECPPRGLAQKLGVGVAVGADSPQKKNNETK